MANRYHGQFVIEHRSDGVLKRRVCCQNPINEDGTDRCIDITFPIPEDTMQDQTLPEGLKKIVNHEGLLQDGPGDRCPPEEVRNPCGESDGSTELFAADRKLSKDEMDRAVDDIKESLDLLVAAHRKKDRKRIFYRIGQLSRLMIDLGRKCADLPPLPNETDLILPDTKKDIIV
jgi:hypothetical protein